MIIPIENQHSYNTIPRNNTLKHAIANRCNAPSRELVIDWKGDCFVCGCEAWLPISVGKITDFAQLADVWRSSTAQMLQADIDSGAFSHCAVDRCGVMDHDKIIPKHVISINVDESCNLRCPSCRPAAIMITGGDDFDRKLAQVQHVKHLLESFDQPCVIVMSGNGDPLASTIMRPLIKEFQPRHNQSIRLFTNGLLLEKQLDESPILNHISQYFISIDAGSKEIYERVRLGGQFAQLITNLNWLKRTRERTGAEVLLKFVLQQDNYQDMQNFCKLCVDYGFHGVIHRLEDWGTWPSFDQHDVVGNINHTDHQAAMYFLQSTYSEYADRIQFNSSLVQAIQS
jgi:sulfatase maturation enzyme AslB (radical SAM superfamily)